MSQLDEQGTPSLDDGAGATGEGFSFYRTAGKESKERNPSGNPIWKDVWESRRIFVGPLFGKFHLNTSESTEVFVISEPHAVLVHGVNVGWIKGKKKQFPNREFVPCTAWSLDDKGRWKQTGKQCPLCIFLGKEPRLMVLWAVLDKREEQDPANNRTVQWNLKYMAVTSDDVREMIFNACSLGARDSGIKPTTRFAKFIASRSNNEKSSSLGSSWIFRKFFTEKDAMAIPQVAKAMQSLADSPWARTWPHMPGKVLAEVCKMHKRVFDEHNLDDWDGYSKEGAIKVLGPAGAAPPKTEGGGPPSLDDAGTSPPEGGTGPSLDDLAGNEEKKSNVDVPETPSLDDLAGAEANPDNPAANPTGTGTKDEDDWVPYDDSAL